MNGSKRSYSASKNSLVKNSAKLKDFLSSSRHKSEEKILEADLANVPIIRQSDNPKILPKYMTILAKLGEDGISMDDLDLLQEDLEKLLSTSAVRMRYLLAEIGEIDRYEDIHDGKAYEKTSLKRKLLDEKPKFKDSRNGMRVTKRNCGLPVNKFVNDARHQEIPKVTVLKNDNSDKFWASIEPYCTNASKEDVTFLDNLIQEFKEIDIKIPNVGEHYSKTWPEEISNEEQNVAKPTSKKSSNNIDLKKNGIHTMVETFSTPQTQRLLAALLEERVLNNLQKNGENGAKITKLKPTDFAKIKIFSSGQKVGTCLDMRLKKELVEQGIITIDDFTKNTPEDEILSEIKKCQQELATVNEYNVEGLSKLKAVVSNDLHSNELNEQLEKIDIQVVDLYNRIMAMRKSAQEQGEDFDRVLFKQITKEFEAPADVLLKRQLELNREINSLTDMQMLY